MAEHEPRTEGQVVPGDQATGDRDAASRRTPYGDDGTTLTGESATSADASSHDLVEPAPGQEPPDA